MIRRKTETSKTLCYIIQVQPVTQAHSLTYKNISPVPPVNNGYRVLLPKGKKQYCYGFYLETITEILLDVMVFVGILLVVMGI